MPASIPVNLIRQWCFCPRVVYYQELLGSTVSRPRWVEQGKSFHDLETVLWKRRNLSRFNLDTGKTHHNLLLESKPLGMHGIADMAIETESEVFGVEFKAKANPKRRGNMLQLCAYSMLLEEHFGKRAMAGFLVGGDNSVITVEINEDCRSQVLRLVSAINEMLSQGRKPSSSASYAQCCNCEYINHCNDR